MAARGIPRNPNVPARSTPRGMELHWRRSAGLLALLALVGYLLYGRGSPVEVFGPRPAPLRVAVTPALAPATPPAAPQPIVALARAQPADDQPVRDAVGALNAAFQSARAGADPAALMRVATGEWLAQEQAALADLRERGLAERWALLRLDIRRVAIDRAGATVCTDELWSRAPSQAADPGPADERRYAERYTLVLRDQRWLVSRIDYLSEPC